MVRGVKEQTEIPLPRTYTRDIIPSIPTPETARKWTHLKRIADQLMPYKEDLDVSLLFGINCARAKRSHSRERRRSLRPTHYTRLGDHRDGRA